MPDVYENVTVFKNIFDLQDFGTYGNDPTFINSVNMSSLYNSPVDSNRSLSTGSPMSTTSSPLHMPTYMSLDNYTAIGEAQLVILEQPVDKFRFRYKSEMIGTHGSLVGASSMSSRKKNAPTVQLQNYTEKAIIRCTLVTSEEQQRIPHAHRLVRREGHTDRDDPHDIEVSQENGFVAAFHGMGIIHTARKYVKDELVRKMKSELLDKNKRKNVNATLSLREEAQIKSNADLYQKRINLNSVALCFQAFIMGANNVMIPLTEPVYSNPINNLKSALTGELKICRIDKFTSSCDGGEEVFILVEKVGKKNIKIKFFELNEDDNEIWYDYGRFSELDVHHQYAIVFRTPPYKDVNITSPKEVFIQLERPTDKDCSEPIKFTYKPSDRIIGRKRPRISCSNSTELTQTLFNTPFNDPSIKSNDSNEIKQMFLQGCSSTELHDFINNIDVDKYMQLLSNSEELSSDGPSTKKSDDDVMFAKNIVFEAINIIKMESNRGSNSSEKERLKKLLTDRSTYGDSPLHAALRYGQRDIVRYILILMGTDPDYKALVNIQNSSGKTPLHYAVLQNQPEITKALLTLGADPNMCDDHGFSPLHTAVRIPDAGACVDVLLSSKLMDIESYNDVGWSPLQLAAEAGSYDAIRSLIQAGANVNNTDKSYGRTVLHLAVEGGHKEIVEYLLKKTDININKSNFSGNTALHTAVAYPGARAKELCKLLMQYGADPHIQNNTRSLEDVEKEKDEPINIKVEVESEDENTEDTAGQSSFDLATNKPEILQLLMDHGNNSQDGSEVASSTKQEVVDDESKSSWLSNEIKHKLATILDKTEGWEKLAKRLNLGFLLETFRQNSSSSSLLLLNYIDVQGDVTVTQIHDLLNEIKEVEAAAFIVEIMKHQ